MTGDDIPWLSNTMHEFWDEDGTKRQTGYSTLENSLFGRGQVWALSVQTVGMEWGMDVIGVGVILTKAIFIPSNSDLYIQFYSSTKPQDSILSIHPSDRPPLPKAMTCIFTT